MELPEAMRARLALQPAVVVIEQIDGERVIALCRPALRPVTGPRSVTMAQYRDALMNLT